MPSSSAPEAKKTRKAKAHTNGSTTTPSVVNEQLPLPRQVNISVFTQQLTQQLTDQLTKIITQNVVNNLSAVDVSFPTPGSQTVANSHQCTITNISNSVSDAIFPVTNQVCSSESSNPSTSSGTITSLNQSDTSSSLSSSVDLPGGDTVSESGFTKRGFISTAVPMHIKVPMKIKEKNGRGNLWSRPFWRTKRWAISQ